jgi:hypothetical protein
MAAAECRRRPDDQEDKADCAHSHRHVGITRQKARKLLLEGPWRGSGAIEPQYDVESVSMPFRRDARNLLCPKERGKKSTCDQFVLPTDQDDARPLRDIGGHSILVAVAPVRDRLEMQPFNASSGFSACWMMNKVRFDMGW